MPAEPDWEPDWKDVRRDYLGRSLRTLEILAKHKITRHTLNERIKAEGWKKRPSAVAARAATAATVKKTSAKTPVAKPASGASVARLTPIAQRRKIFERLHNTIARKLALIESRIEKQEKGRGKQISAADFERDTRGVGQLIKSLEQVTEFDHDQRGKRISGAAAKSASVAATALADEADRLRRELAERLQRLVDPAAE